MKTFIAPLFAISTTCFSLLPASAQIALNPEQVRVFDKDGQPANIAQIVERCEDANVLFLGEEHNDAVGHALQAEVFKQVIGQYKSSRKVALSMEMFERDTQVVLDEYLKDIITEKQFLACSRPWNNYEQDYKPLVVRAKENALPVIAANAPRRYVNLVSRKGREALNGLSPQAKQWLAPLPYAKASEPYAQKLNAMMGGPSHGGDIGDSQSLWDATMAYSISQYLKAAKNPLVVQLNGKFHSEQRLGTVEHLLRYQPKAKVIVVTVSTSEKFPEFDKKENQAQGGFVVLTDPKVEKSFK